MISKLIKLVLGLGILSVLLYIVTENSTPVELKLFLTEPIKTSLGVLTVAVFFSGVLISVLFGSLLRIPAYLRERSLVSQKKQSEQFFDKVLQARSAAASGDITKSKNLWEQISRNDSSKNIALLELAKLYQAEGDNRSALKILTTLKAKIPANPELLFRATELNLELGNKTAAIDNLTVLLTNEPNSKAAELAMQLSEDLGRYDDALEFASMVNKSFRDVTADENRIRFKQISNDKNLSSSDKISLLTKFTKKNPDSVDAIAELARTYIEGGKVGEGYKSYIKASRLNGGNNYLAEMLEHASESENSEQLLKTLAGEEKNYSKTNPTRSGLAYYITLSKALEAKGNIEEAYEKILNSASYLDLPNIPERDNLREEYWLVRSRLELELGKSDDLKSSLNSIPRLIM